MRLTSSAAALVLSFLAQAQAQYLVNELSFGYGVRYVMSFWGSCDDATTNMCVLQDSA